MSDRSLIADAQAAARREAGQPQPDLRQQLAAALRTTPSVLMDTPEERDRHASNRRNHHVSHHYYWGCAMCRGEVDTLADAVLAVVMPLLDAKQAENDGLRKLHGVYEAARLGNLIGLDEESAVAVRGVLAETEAELHRYRAAWQSARHRAAKASGTLDALQSNLATREEGLPCSAVANCDGNCCQQAKPTCGVGNPRQAATCTNPPPHDSDHHDAFGHTWPRRADDKPLFTTRAPQ